MLLLRHSNQLHWCRRILLSGDQSTVIGLQVFERFDCLDLPDSVIELLLEHSLELHLEEIAALALCYLGSDRHRPPESMSLLAVVCDSLLERVFATVVC